MTGLEPARVVLSTIIPKLSSTRLLCVSTRVFPAHHIQYFCARGGTRTHNPLLNRQPLYPIKATRTYVSVWASHSRIPDYISAVILYVSENEMISVLPTTGTIAFRQNIEGSVLYHLRLARFTSIPCCNTVLLIVSHEKLVGLQSNSFAESEGFEPPEVWPSLVFKTSAFDRSANSPVLLSPKVPIETKTAEVYRVVSVGFEPTTSTLSAWCSTRPNYETIFSVVLSGFEPPTPNLSGWCSNQLSYRTIFVNFVRNIY